MSTSVANVVSHFPSAENGFTTTTSGSVSSGATTVGLNSVAGYANGEVVVFVIDPTDADKKQTFTGTIDTAGVQVTDVVWTAGTNQTHALGATVVDYATATHISMMTKGISKSLAQDGHIATTGVATFTDHIDVTDAKSIRDGNNNELITFSQTASAVNELTIANAATGNGPEIQATGGDTNIDVEVIAKGTGGVILPQKFLSGRHQAGDGTTNTDITKQVVQIGWGYIVGDGTNRIEKTVTFPTAFSSAPIVWVSFNASRSTAAGTPTGPDWFTTAVASTVATQAYSNSITASGFQAVIQRSDADTLSSANNYGFTWIAIGTV